MNNNIKLFLQLEKWRFEKTYNIDNNKIFAVYKYRTFKNYRLGNGIFIKNSKGKRLKDWENIFDEIFDKEIYQHKTFTFIENNALNSLKQEARDANYKEINEFPIAICFDNPFKNRFSLSNLKVDKIESKQDWENYRYFMKTVHSDKLWHYNEGFYIFKKMSDSLNLEHFCIRKINSKEIVSVIGLWMYNNIGKVESLETHPSYRRMGLAKYLLSFLFQYAFRKYNAKGFILLSLNNDITINFYRKFGFKTIGKKVELVDYITY